MARKKKEPAAETSKLPPPPKDKENPSLIVMEGVTKLRVFEDFFCEKELPKWKSYRARIKQIADLFGISIHGKSDFDDIKRRYLHKINDSDLSEEEKNKIIAAYEEIKPLIPQLQKMFDELNDDRWNIQDKHEREFDELLSKLVLVDTISPKKPSKEASVSVGTLVDKFKSLFGKGKKKQQKPVESKQEPEAPAIEPIEIDVSMANLKDHILHTSTAEMTAYRIKVEEIRKKFLRAGQYEKVKALDAAIGKIIEEQVLIDKGFTKYVEEEQMIKFLQTTERGALCNFMRYYEGIVPDDVIAKKEEVDALKIFDNYVICYYMDPKEAAAKATKKTEEKKVEKKRSARRDPILFGVIKNSRKLYYICDWVTDTDDLTLEVLEKALGETSKKLDSSITHDPTVELAIRSNVNDLSTIRSSYDRRDGWIISGEYDSDSDSYTDRLDRRALTAMRAYGSTSSSFDR